jgi:hypothetical protein
MFKVIVNLPARKEIFPYDSEMGAIYFATLVKERAYCHKRYCPSVDVMDDETGEIVFQIPAIYPCEYYHGREFSKIRRQGDSPCRACPNHTCDMNEDVSEPW